MLYAPAVRTFDRPQFKDLPLYLYFPLSSHVSFPPSPFPSSCVCVCTRVCIYIYLSDRRCSRAIDLSCLPRAKMCCFHYTSLLLRTGTQQWWHFVPQVLTCSNHHIFIIQIHYILYFFDTLTCIKVLQRHFLCINNCEKYLQTSIFLFWRFFIIQKDYLA